MKLSPLPIDASIPALLEQVQKNVCVIVTATPGAGKSTRLPPALLKLTAKKIAVLQPRRIAALGTSHRVAEEQGFSIGNEVGYQVRGDSKVSSSTRLSFMTDAILLRLLLEDAELSDYGMIVIDEFHERNLNQDVALASLKELSELRADLKVIIMSATINPRPLLNYWGQGSSHFDVLGRVFPLTITYQAQAQLLQATPEWVERVTQTIDTALEQKAYGLLVFLPGSSEIRRVHQALITKYPQREIQILQGSLSLKEQARILGWSSGSRIVLATNIAEASVTLDGIDCVIDTGLVKTTDFNSKSGFSRLALHRISKFSAEQRAGRAARLGPGVCHRLWHESEYSAFRESSVSEILRSDLASTQLWLAANGITQVKNFCWYEAPPTFLIQQAQASLEKLQAIDAEGRLTELGHSMLKFPTSPRKAQLMVRAQNEDKLGLGARICALLEDPQSTPNSHGDSLIEALQALLILEHSDKQPPPILQWAYRLGARAKEIKTFEPQTIKRWMLLSHLDQLCKLRPGQVQRGVMMGGRGVKLTPECQLSQYSFFIPLSGLDRPQDPETQIYSALGIEREMVLTELSSIIETKIELELDEDKGLFYQRTSKMLGDLPLDESQRSLASAEDLAELWRDYLVQNWDQLLRGNSALGSWWRRLEILSHWQNELKSYLSLETTKEWAELASYNKTSWKQICESDLASLFESLIPSNLVHILYTQAPSHFTAPTGTQVEIEYESVEQAYVDIRLQELFGLTDTPTLGFGNITLSFRLLGPNYRPVQITSHLARFWEESYFEVRKQLRGRYPKHSWPENPLEARPEARGRKRSHKV